LCGGDGGWVVEQVVVEQVLDWVTQIQFLPDTQWKTKSSATHFIAL